MTGVNQAFSTEEIAELRAPYRSQFGGEVKDEGGTPQFARRFDIVDGQYVYGEYQYIGGYHMPKLKHDVIFKNIGRPK